MGEVFTSRPPPHNNTIMDQPFPPPPIIANSFGFVSEVTLETINKSDKFTIGGGVQTICMETPTSTAVDDFLLKPMRFEWRLEDWGSTSVDFVSMLPAGAILCAKEKEALLRKRGYLNTQTTTNISTACQRVDEHGITKLSWTFAVTGCKAYISKAYNTSSLKVKWIRLLAVLVVDDLPFYVTRSNPFLFFSDRSLLRKFSDEEWDSFLQGVYGSGSRYSTFNAPLPPIPPPEEEAKANGVLFEQLCSPIITPEEYNYTEMHDLPIYYDNQSYTAQLESTSPLVDTNITTSPSQYTNFSDSSSEDENSVTLASYNKLLGEYKSVVSCLNEHEQHAVETEAWFDEKKRKYKATKENLLLELQMMKNKVKQANNELLAREAAFRSAQQKLENLQQEMEQSKTNTQAKITELLASTNNVTQAQKSSLTLLQMQLAAKEEELVKTKTDYRSAKGHAQTLEDMVAKLRRDLESEKIEVKDLKAQVSQARDTKDLKSELKQTKAALAKAQKEIKKLEANQTKKKELTQTQTNLERQVKKLLEDNRDLRYTNAELTEQLEEEKKDLTAELNTLVKQKRAWHEEKDVLSARILSLEEMCGNLREKIADRQPYKDQPTPPRNYTPASPHVLKATPKTPSSMSPFKPTSPPAGSLVDLSDYCEEEIQPPPKKIRPIPLDRFY